MENAVADVGTMSSILMFIYNKSNDQHSKLKIKSKYNDEQLETLNEYFFKQTEFKPKPNSLCEAIRGITEISSLGSLCTDVDTAFENVQIKLSTYHNELEPTSQTVLDEKWFTDFNDGEEQKLRNHISSNFNSLMKINSDDSTNALEFIFDSCKYGTLKHVTDKINKISTEPKLISFIFNKYDKAPVVTDTFKFVLYNPLKQFKL